MTVLRAAWLGLVTAGWVVASASARPAQPTTTLSGNRLLHIVQAGEALSSIGARFGVEPRVVARANFLHADARLRIGQSIIVDNRHIVPEPTCDEEVLINIPQRMLFRFVEGQFAAAYPVAVGSRGWPTFTGPFSVTSLETDPVWDVPLSIQEEQRRAGQVVQARVPPGPSNPLGKHWIGLDRPGFGIHGTNAPGSIHGFRTHGCIRLHPDDAAALFGTARVGTQGRIVYEPVLLAETGTGEILLEAHPDPYGRQPDAVGAARELAARGRLVELIDWDAVAVVLRLRDGTPVDVSRR